MTTSPLLRRQLPPVTFQSGPSVSRLKSSLKGPAGRLEALLEEPEDREPVEAALVCHPHPQHGGTMHNKVTIRLARGLRRADLP